MPSMTPRFALAIALFCPVMFAYGADAPIEHFLKQPTFAAMKISPDGAHLAATVPQGDDKTILLVMDRATLKPTAVLQMRGREHIDDFFWANDERLVVSATKKEGMLDTPVPTGELYGVNADGKGTAMLFGYRMASPTESTNIRKPEAERASAFLLGMLPGSDDQALIVVQPWDNIDANLSEVRRMSVTTGRTSLIAKAPMPRASFLADRDGNVRLSFGELNSGVQQVHVRPAKGGAWRLLNDESVSGYHMDPLAFEADGRTVLIRRGHDQGPDGLYRLDLESGQQTKVFQDAVVNPGELLRGIDPEFRYAVRVQRGKPELVALDESAKEARLAKAIAGAFPDQHAYATSYTRDGKLGLVHVYSDRNSGEFYLFDLEKMRATFLGATREWMDPAQMAQVRPIELKARDGTALHGYLTLPHGREAKDLPLVMNPHGGPHGERDIWAFDEEAQLLASRGYAVLQLNFRGSGGYGRAFEMAGYRQWGGTMQDDIADAVRWTISEGIADPKRVCIYGASYGGYSALMNAARYPDLYQCTVGYVGVYDLALMYNEGDVQESMFGRAYLARILGTDKLAENTPVTYADRIKIPVMLIHGGEDFRVPQTHADRMRAALSKAGNEPVWLVERREGHGFYNMDNRIKLYTQLLAFLDEHIGAGTAASATN
jgi:dipeptidyl aminopeptidase/acylaminoacyl peptidase